MNDCKMDDWGEIILKKIFCDDDAFWCLIDELYDDKSRYICNRDTILEAYRTGSLYGLKVLESDSMYERGAMMDRIFCINSFYLLPCFCIKENNKAIIIWTHKRARRKGFAKKLVELLHIEDAYNPSPSSIPFWEACNINIDH